MRRCEKWAGRAYEPKFSIPAQFQLTVTVTLPYVVTLPRFLRASCGRGGWVPHSLYFSIKNLPAGPFTAS